MRAVTFDRFGPADVLEISDVPDLEPRPGQLLVRNFATALNRADLLQRRGLYPPPPGESEVLGLEFAGEVAAWGVGVDGVQVGDRVFGLLAGGGYAEQVVVDARMAITIPDELSFDAAAAVPEAFFTAFENLFTLGGLTRGQSVLIHAGASGVGSAAIQLARSFGVRVFATAGSAEKRELAVELGASRAIDYRADDFAAIVLEETDSRGVDVVLDFVGASYWDQNLQALTPGGKLLVLGLLGGAKIEADLGRLLMRRIQVIGSSLRGRSLEDKIRISTDIRELVLPRIVSQEIRPVLDCVLPLEDVREAHLRMERNLNLGKIVLRL